MKRTPHTLLSALLLRRTPNANTHPDTATPGLETGWPPSVQNTTEPGPSAGRDELRSNGESGDAVDVIDTPAVLLNMRVVAGPMETDHGDDPNARPLRPSPPPAARPRCLAPAPHSPTPRRRAAELTRGPPRPHPRQAPRSTLIRGRRRTLRPTAASAAAAGSRAPRVSRPRPARASRRRRPAGPSARARGG